MGSLKISQNPLLLLIAILNKNPPLAQRRQNIEIYNLSCGWQATVGLTLVQRWQNLLTNTTNSQHWANVGPAAECYLGTFYAAFHELNFSYNQLSLPTIIISLQFSYTTLFKHINWGYHIY